MVEESSIPTIIGAWYRYREKIRSEEDFGIFYIFDNNWCFDDNGYSDITMNIFNKDEIRFHKKYQDKSGMPIHALDYTGKSKDGRIYEGKWFDKFQEGKFILEKIDGKPKTEMVLSEIEKTLGNLQFRAFYEKMMEKRRQFSFSPFKEALKD